METVFVDSKGAEIIIIPMGIPPVLDLVIESEKKHYKVREVRQISDEKYEATVSKIGKDQV